MRKFIRILLLFFFSIIIVYLSYCIYKKFNERKAAEIRIQTLPDAQFYSLEGDSVNIQSFDKNRPLVIIYFHPNCEYCQYEAKEIGQNANLLSKLQLIMITSKDSKLAVENFCNKYHLWEVDNIEILIDKENNFEKTFSKVIIPSIYIYDENQKLKSRFLGETKLETITNEIINLKI